MQATQRLRVMGLILMVMVTALILAPTGSVAQTIEALTGNGTLVPAQPHRYADILLEGDVLSGTYTFQPQPADIGKQADVYLVARISEGGTEQWYRLDKGRWLSWDGDLSTLMPTDERTLASTETVSVLQGDAVFAGHYQLYAGYRTAGGPLVHTGTPFAFTVDSLADQSLLQFDSDEAMEAYLKEGMQNTATVAYSSSHPPLLATDSVTASPGRSSSTNLQQSGVDEADNFKVDGDLLFMLKNCNDKTCLDVQRLVSSSATAVPLTSVTLDTTQGPSGLYLVEEGIAGRRMLVTVAGDNTFWGWFRLWDWRQGKTRLEFLDINTPTNIGSLETLTIDGALVASRRVGDTLYLVTRYTPAIDGYQPFPVDKAQEERNSALLAETSLPGILPRVMDTRDQVQALVEGKDCYLPLNAVDTSSNPSIITISAIPLAQPKALRSKCFLGASETLYMSNESLYLATTRWDYAMPAADDLRYNPEHTTAIHKFALAGGDIAYRGSGTVKGHLGWEEDKKSFRMGENGAYLNVVTSVGDTWNDSASTRLSVLREKGSGGKLETVSVIDGIGKPGEQLYAARFLGNRAYLVTFRVTDPLYVVDLSNQLEPAIVGELEIDGYSDYLHPVSEDLLLGIGKDAVADDISTDPGRVRGAWPQGVKVALFDVSDPADPREIDALVLGKRGTESEVLWDHHAFSFLPAQGAEPARFAIPVRLHDKTPQWEGFKPDAPGAWYDYTHTALYSFEVSAQGVSQAGRIIAEVNTASSGGTVTPGRPVDGNVTIMPVDGLIAPWVPVYGERSVLIDDAVYYLYNGKLLGSFWGENQTP